MKWGGRRVKEAEDRNEEVNRQMALAIEELHSGLAAVRSGQDRVRSVTMDLITQAEELSFKNHQKG
jgi:hypothetical protein